jgi:hypothetical protein
MTIAPELSLHDAAKGEKLDLGKSDAVLEVEKTTPQLEMISKEINALLTEVTCQYITSSPYLLVDSLSSWHAEQTRFVRTNP